VVLAGAGLCSGTMTGPPTCGNRGLDASVITHSIWVTRAPKARDARSDEQCVVAGVSRASHRASAGKELPPVATAWRARADVSGFHPAHVVRFLPCGSRHKSTLGMLRKRRVALLDASSTWRRVV
jgi:hypothetical protein